MKSIVEYLTGNVKQENDSESHEPKKMSRYEFRKKENELKRNKNIVIKKGDKKDPKKRNTKEILVRTKDGEFISAGEYDDTRQLSTIDDKIIGVSK